MLARLFTRYTHFDEQMKASFTVEEEGFDEADEKVKQDLLNQFVDFIQRAKVAANIPRIA